MIYSEQKQALEQAIRILRDKATGIVSDGWTVLMHAQNYLIQQAIEVNHKEMVR